MSKNRVIYNGVWLIVILFGMVVSVMASGNIKNMLINDEVRIIVYSRGKKTVLGSQSQSFILLRQKCENFLESADNMAKTLITQNMIENIKEKDSAIEIVYSSLQEIETAYYKKKIKADHLLIPLTGKFVNKGENASVMIFFYSRRTHTSPYSASRDVSDIEELLRSMKIDVSKP